MSVLVWMHDHFKNQSLFFFYRDNGVMVLRTSRARAQLVFERQKWPVHWLAQPMPVPTNGKIARDNLLLTSSPWRLTIR
jgi:hypothetical protein